MTSRQMKAWGLGFGGALAIFVAVVMGVTEITPTWVGTVLSVVGVVAELFGIKVAQPEVE